MKPGDPTPVSGSETDVSPVGRAKPPHERTADEEPDIVDWHRIARTNEFNQLLRSKARFIVPATIFFIIYYFALPVLVGYAPELMQKRVWGVVNVAYLFALSQFIMAWIVAALYMKAARRWDAMARELLDKTL
jgi:uncharacterized membrane protein (DUF485 family)